MGIDLTSIKDRLAIAGKYATKYGIDTALVCAVAEQESSWMPTAIRFEPAFYQRYIVKQNIQSPTEAYARAFSWGLLQLMGEVARELGFPNRFLSDLCDPDTALDWGGKHLKNKLNSHDTVEAALLAWNGGGNPEYPSQVLARVSKYQNPQP